MEPGKVGVSVPEYWDCVACGDSGFFQQKCTSWWIKNGSLGKENTVKKSQCHLWPLACLGRRESVIDTQLHPCALNQVSRQYKNVKITKKDRRKPLTPAAYHPCHYSVSCVVSLSAAWTPVHRKAWLEVTRLCPLCLCRRAWGRGRMEGSSVKQKSDSR